MCCEHDGGRLHYQYKVTSWQVQFADKSMFSFLQASTNESLEIKRKMLDIWQQINRI